MLEFNTIFVATFVGFKSTNSDITKKFRGPIKPRSDKDEDSVVASCELVTIRKLMMHVGIK